KPMVGPIVDEVAESIVKMEEQMVALVIDVEVDIAMLFGDDNFSDDDSKRFEDDEEVITPVIDMEEDIPCYSVMAILVMTTLRVLRMRRMSERQLVKKVIHVSDAEVADGITIWEIGPRVSAIKGQGQQTATQRDEAIEGLSQQVQELQTAVQQRDLQI
nr:hypothetical protein [Tanacetum cinerariifolium]